MNAGDEYPPKATGKIEAGSFASILKSNRPRTLEFVDNWSIHYCLTIAGGTITGTANGGKLL